MPIPNHWTARAFPKIVLKLVSKPVSTAPIMVTGTEKADNKYSAKEEKGLKHHTDNLMTCIPLSFKRQSYIQQEERLSAEQERR